MEEKNRKVRAIVRETMDIRVSEDEVLELVTEHIREKYPDFNIQNLEIVCGMGQGQGYFEYISADLVNEREEVNGKVKK